MTGNITQTDRGRTTRMASGGVIQAELLMIFVGKKDGETRRLVEYSKGLEQGSPNFVPVGYGRLRWH